MSGRSLAAAALALVLSLAPARAAFHLAEIDEAMSGVEGDPSVQYVEIRQTFPILQRFVSHSRLTYFNCTGTTASVLLEVPGDVPIAGQDVRWIMASPSAAVFLAAVSLTPDFTFAGGID